MARRVVEGAPLHCIRAGGLAIALAVATGCGSAPPSKGSNVAKVDSFEETEQMMTESQLRLDVMRIADHLNIGIAGACDQLALDLTDTSSRARLRELQLAADIRGGKRSHSSTVPGLSYRKKVPDFHEKAGHVNSHLGGHRILGVEGFGSVSLSRHG